MYTGHKERRIKCTSCHSCGPQADALNLEMSDWGEDALRRWNARSPMPLIDTTKPFVDDELKFRKILEKFQDVQSDSMSAEDACIAWHSKGCPLEIAEEAATDKKEFARLVEKHRAKSDTANKNVWGKEKEGANG